MAALAARRRPAVARRLAQDLEYSRVLCLCFEQSADTSEPKGRVVEECRLKEYLRLSPGAPFAISSAVFYTAEEILTNGWGPGCPKFG
jgi:hypothetical protein